MEWPRVTGTAVRFNVKLFMLILLTLSPTLTAALTLLLEAPRGNTPITPRDAAAHLPLQCGNAYFYLDQNTIKAEIGGIDLDVADAKHGTIHSAELWTMLKTCIPTEKPETHLLPVILATATATIIATTLTTIISNKISL